MFDWLNKQKIGTRISLGFGFVILLFLFTGLIALSTFSSTLIRISIYRDNTQNVLLLMQMGEQIINAQLAAAHYREKPTETHLQEAKSNLKEVQVLYHQINAEDFSTKQKSAMAQISSKITAYNQFLQDMVTNRAAIENLLITLYDLGEAIMKNADLIGYEANASNDMPASYLLGKVRKSLRIFNV